MSRARQIFGQPTAPKPTTRNLSGAAAFGKSDEEAYLQMLLTNTLGNTYYTRQFDHVQGSKELHERMVADDPKFVEKAIVYARNQGYMRTQPIMGLAYLSLPVQTWNGCFERAFDNVIRTPKDLEDFTTIRKSLATQEREFRHREPNGTYTTVRRVTSSVGGRRVKDTVNIWLKAKINEYWAIKYGARGNGGYSLFDLFSIYRPDFGYENPIVRYLKNGDVAPSEKQLWNFELLKRATSTEDKIRAIRDGRLPHEVSTSFAGTDKGVWFAIIDQLPVFALLKNLATLERHGVIGEARDKIRRTLQNAETIKKSKILPYRFLEAEKHVTTGWVRDALRDALELAFDNIPDIQGETAVLLDCSPSMKPLDYRNPHGRGMNDNTMEVASVFATALCRKAQDSALVAFDADAEIIHVSSRDSVLTQAAKVAQWGVRGGTSPGNALNLLTNRSGRYDNIIVITDGQENTGTPFAHALMQYRSIKNPNVKTFVLDVSPNNRQSITPSDPYVNYFYGWSDQVLQYISMASRGWSSLASYVRNTDIKTLAGKETEE